MKQDIRKTEEFKDNGFWKGNDFEVEYPDKTVRRFYLVSSDEPKDWNKDELNKVFEAGISATQIEACLDNDGNPFLTTAYNLKGFICQYKAEA